MSITYDVELISNLNDQSIKSLSTGNTDRVGRVFHESLLRSLLRKEAFEGQAFAVTDKRVFTTSLNFETHEQRREAARNAGRIFANEAVAADEKLLFIGGTAIGISHSDDGEVAMTFIQNLSPMHEVTVEEEFVPAFNESEIKLFLDELSDAGAITTIHDGDLCVSADVFDALSEEQRKDQGVTKATNALLFETFVGSSYAFKFCRDKATQTEAA
jgi:hypothetical protein